MMNLHFTQEGVHRVLEVDLPRGVLSYEDALQAVLAGGWQVDDNRLLITYEGDLVDHPQLELDLES